MSRIVIQIFVAVVLSSCGTSFSKYTNAERESGYTYIPLDPFSVQTEPGVGCQRFIGGINFKDDFPYRRTLDSLPDNAVRMSVERFDASGSVTYGPAGVGTEGESYRVTVDYINADTTNIPIWMSKKAALRFLGPLSPKSLNLEYKNVDPLAPLPPNFIPGSEIYSVTRENPGHEKELVVEELYRQQNIPVYVGIGLRVTANVDVLKGRVNIAGLGIIGAESEAEKLKGSLVVQTLGVNGKSIAAALPIHSELNRTTAQNAIVAVGAIKALLYEKDVVISPRVVGIYLPFPGGKPLVNAIISEISKNPVIWERPCNTLEEENSP